MAQPHCLISELILCHLDRVTHLEGELGSRSLSCLNAEDSGCDTWRFEHSYYPTIRVVFLAIPREFDCAKSKLVQDTVLQNVGRWVGCGRDLYATPYHPQ